MSTPVNEAEYIILAAILDDNTNYDRFVSEYGLREDYFYTGLAKDCFQAITDVWVNAKSPVDPLIISNHLEKKGYSEFDKIYKFLIYATENLEILANYEPYITILKDASIRKDTLETLDKIKQFIKDPSNKSIKAQELLEYAEGSIFGLNEYYRDKKSNMSIATLATDLETYLQDRQENPKKFIGLSSGFSDVDRLTGGLNNGELIVIAARPSMGKTSFAMNIATNIANKENVLVFSMEMGTREIMMRILSSLTRIDLKKLMTGDIYNTDWDKINSNLNIIKSMNLLLDDASSLTPQEIRSKAREIKRKQGLSLILIDYLQLMSADATRSNTESRNLEISSISRSLKSLARELNIPVIVLSQLNRSLESRQVKRPILSDLRESGAIEQDADVVMAIYRDEVYNEQSLDAGRAEIIVLKNRNGPTGSVKLQFKKECTSFGDLLVEDEEAFH